MKYHPQTDDDILRNMLNRTETTSHNSLEDTDEIDELMGLFLDGTLQGDDRELFLRRLDEQPSARAILGTYMKHMEHAPAAPTLAPPATAKASSIQQTIEAVKDFVRNLFGEAHEDTSHSSARSFKSVGRGDSRGAVAGLIPAFQYFAQVRMAFAAALLIAMVGLMWFTWRTGENARMLAALQIHPNLMDFDYWPNGEMNKGGDGASSAGLAMTQTVLDRVTTDDERTNLQRGYELLKLNRPDEARKVFQEVIDSHPQSFYGWMGRGLAGFMQREESTLSDAEAAFDKCLKIDPTSTAARINRAMTLTELGRSEHALNEWNRVDYARLPEAQRAAIAEELKALQAESEPDRGN